MCARLFAQHETCEVDRAVDERGLSRKLSAIGNRRRVLPWRWAWSLARIAVLGRYQWKATLPQRLWRDLPRFSQPQARVCRRGELDAYRADERQRQRDRRSRAHERRRARQVTRQLRRASSPASRRIFFGSWIGRGAETLAPDAAMLPGASCPTRMSSIPTFGSGSHGGRPPRSPTIRSRRPPARRRAAPARRRASRWGHVRGRVEGEHGRGVRAPGAQGGAHLANDAAEEASRRSAPPARGPGVHRRRVDGDG